MTEGQGADLDAILSLWHRWQQSDKGVNGFNRRALVVGDCRPWRLQYEGQQDQLDADLDNARCRQVHHEVNQLGEPHRTAIFEDARNLCTGLAVWRSPRLPADPEDRKSLVRLARASLTLRLRSAGVME